jgi:hypothetical protein
MNQSSSLTCWLSMLSPVDTATSKGRPAIGPTATSLSWRIIASPTWQVSVSCERYAELNGTGSWGGSESRSRNSTRVVDWASMTWTSVRWTIVASAVRRSSRPALGSAPSARTTCGYPGASTRRT